MRIAHLSVGDVFSAKWTAFQAQEGHEVHLITQGAPLEPPGRSVVCHRLPFRRPFGYYLNVWHLKRLIERIRPDVLHVHYATGFGTLGRLAGFRPCVLSAWGSDILTTPEQSTRMRNLVIKNLIHYDCVCVTSLVLQTGIRRLVPELGSTIIPFGVDTRVFAPRHRPATETITIGTVKTMHPTYGIDLLIRAFAAVRQRLALSNAESAKQLRLMIVGGGPCLEEYHELTRRLGIAEVTQFHGQLPNAMIPEMLGKIDIFVALSRAESFGVAVVEASACGIPVLVSNVGGLPEVVVDGETGFIVPLEDVDRATTAIETLVCSPDLRSRLGSAGRALVQKRFQWGDCCKIGYSVYDRALALSGRKGY